MTIALSFRSLRAVDQQLLSLDNRVDDLGQGSWVRYDSAFVENSKVLYRQLIEELPLSRTYLRIMGRCVETPRLTSWHGDPGSWFTYSQTQFDPQPWTPTLSTLRDRLERRLGERFNSVLANFYRNGSDSIALHADNEPELGPSRDNILIASLSFGAHRRFILKHRQSKRRYVYELEDGCLLLMGGTTQQHFVHGISKTKRPTGARLNLTFRIVRPLPSQIAEH